MIQMTIPSKKPTRVSAIRDFPHGCGTQRIKNQKSEIGGEVVGATSEIRQESIGVARPAFSGDRINEVDSMDVIMKKAGFTAPVNTDVGRGKFVSSFSKFRPSCGSKVKPLSSEEAIRLIASQSRRRKLSSSSISIQRKLLVTKAVKNQRNLPQKSDATALRARTRKPSQNRDERRSTQLGLIPVMRRNKITNVLSERERVRKASRLFKLVFKELKRDIAAGESTTTTNKIHYLTRDILISEGIQVNPRKKIGKVPGIEVGDKFQYKAELSLIGLHFDIRRGIDYINGEDIKLATSIISSEGNGYIDRFSSDVIIYSGQGGNLTSKDQRIIKDQKLETGNLALANSMEAKKPVRVIRGLKIPGKRGKCYVYDGLYLVQEYWQERGRGGNVLFKFKLRRVPGQPSVHLSYY